MVLLVLACSGAVWGDNLTVTITKRNGAERTETGQESLQKALQGYGLYEVDSIEVSAGSFETDDWYWLKANVDNLNSLKKFVVTDEVESVADVPDTYYSQPFFAESLEELRVSMLKKVGENAFDRCYGLRIVSLPDATKIGMDAFNGCNSLVRISLPAATEIDDKAFYYCTDLTSVSLPAATKIGMYAFNDCKRLTSVLLPAATEIGSGAFSGCTGLTSVQLGPSPASAGWDAFANCPNSRTLIITDAAGVPLVGEALAIAADKYHRDEGASNDGKWQGFAIENNPPMLLLAKILPSGAGAVKVTRKKDGATVNQGDVLTKGDVLEVQAEHANGYRVQAITAEGAKKIGEKEWEVTATSGTVVFTVEFE